MLLSADSIAATLCPGNPESAGVAAGRQFVTRLRDAISAGDRVAVESTLSGRSLAATMRTARERGYRIRIFFVYVDSPDVSVGRVRLRVREGGHHVPEEDIRRRYLRSLQNFWHLYRPIAHEWNLVYNGPGKSVDVAGGTLDEIKVLVEPLYSMFLRQVGDTTVREPSAFDAGTQQFMQETMQIMHRAVHKAQERHRRLGVPNVYCYNGITHYEWPNGELSTQDPWRGQMTKPDDIPDAPPGSALTNGDGTADGIRGA